MSFTIQNIMEWRLVLEDVVNKGMPRKIYEVKTMDGSLRVVEIGVREIMRKCLESVNAFTVVLFGVLKNGTKRYQEKVMKGSVFGFLQ